MMTLGHLALRCLYLPRLAAVRLRRGSVLRSACVALLKLALPYFRGTLATLPGGIRPLDYPELSFTSTNSMVMEAVYWFGVQGYEGIVAQTWIDLCATSRSVLEVGGNVGLFTVLGARAAGGQYVAVEPVPEVAALLRGNVERNGLAGRAQILQAAVIPGRTPAQVSLNVPREGRDAPVGAHLTVGSEVSGRSTDRTIVVDGLPFPALADGCDVIKIDAEGIEAELLESAFEQILRQRPAILVEVLPEAVRLGALITDLARRCGYTILVLPEYGSDQPVQIPADLFNAAVPARYNSKDVLLRVM